VNPPRWFFALAAACLVVLTAASAYALVWREPSGRYVPVTLPGVPDTTLAVLDTGTGAVCFPLSAHLSCSRDARR
jgi:hypothetical protein